MHYRVPAITLTPLIDLLFIVIFSLQLNIRSSALIDHSQAKSARKSVENYKDLLDKNTESLKRKSIIVKI